MSRITRPLLAGTAATLSALAVARNGLNVIKQHQYLKAGLSLLLLLPVYAVANNAFNLVGYGAEAVSMGGADSAIANSPFAVNSNPAGLAQIQGQVLDLSVTEWTQRSVHKDQIGNSRKEINGIAGMWGAGGYVRHIEDSPFSVGAALFIQGGTGAIYKHLDTPLSRRDEVTSQFGVFKFSPGIGWQVNDRIRLGMSLAINYSTAAQTFFPNSSVFVAPGNPNNFAGINFKDASGLGISGRIGGQYLPREDVSLGFVYGSRTKLPIKGGSLRANYSNFPGIGSVVRYDDAQLKGFRLPQELTAGIAFKPSQDLRVSLEETWYDWSEVVKVLGVVAKSPRSSNPLVPQTVALASPLNLRDQHVYKVGVQYTLDEKTRLSVATNYGRRALPDENLSVGLPIIQGPHYMFGAERKVTSEWTVLGVVEYVPLVHVTYTNASGLWGSNAVESNVAVEFHVAAVRRW